VQLVSIHKHSTNRLASQSVGRRQRLLFFPLSFFSLFLFFLFFSFPFFFFSFFPSPYSSLYPSPLFLFRRQADLYYARQTRRRQSVCDRVGAVVPSSVVALSAGWQGGWCPRRKRGPRGTRRRTPRWFHAVKAVRLLQQLRIAAPPTTDIHIRAIRHPGGGAPATAETGRGREGLREREREAERMRRERNSGKGWKRRRRRRRRRRFTLGCGDRDRQGWRFPGERSLFTRIAGVRAEKRR